MQNQLVVLHLGTKLKLQSLRQPIDRTAWEFPPVIVNAFYNPSLNDICKRNSSRINNDLDMFFLLGFPAGILQLPFFDKAVPK
jgi:predicted metalloendopeptidase